MSYDRFLRFSDGHIPPPEQFGVLLFAYLGNIGEVVWREDMRRWLVTLPGNSSDTMPAVWRLVGEKLRREGHPDAPAADDPERESIYASHEEPGYPRWFEVFVAEHVEHVSIITRHADTYTNAVADGFAKLAARAFGAQIAEG